MTIDLDECFEPCDMAVLGGCDALHVLAEECDSRCPWYKPQGCGDWVRVGNIIYPPEEYERKFVNEDDGEQKTLYWHIKRVPKRKK